MTLITDREFATRRRAQWLCHDAGRHALAMGAARLAAKLFRSGASCERASRQAFRAVVPSDVKVRA